LEEQDRHLTHTTITIGVEQKEWLNDSDINLSSLVRGIIDEARQRDDFSAQDLEEHLFEMETIRTRNEMLEERVDELLEEHQKEREEIIEEFLDTFQTFDETEAAEKIREIAREEDDSRTADEE